jgi:hypothetical protein
MTARSAGDAKRLTTFFARPWYITETPLVRVARAVLLALSLWVVWSATFIFYASPDHVAVIVGEPSSRDIKAPRQVTYVSEIKTNEARAVAASRIPEVFTGPDLEVSNQHLLTARNVTDYITIIRQDSFGDQETKLELLREIPGLAAGSNVLLKMIEMSEDDWKGVTAETWRVLDLVMRDEIRESQTSEARRQVPRMIRHTLSYEQQITATALVQGMVGPNSFYDAEATAGEREAAREAVEPVHWTIRQGESILREGEIVSELAMEKLQVLGLIKTDSNWQDIVGVVLLSLIVVAALSFYVVRTSPLLLDRPRREVLLVLILMVVGFSSRVALPEHPLMPYLFPAATAAMLVAMFIDVQMAVVVGIVSAVMVGLNTDRSVEMMVYALVSSMIGALLLWRMEQIASFFRAAVYIALANVAVIVAFRLPAYPYDSRELIQLMMMGGINGVISSSLAFVAYAAIGRVFGIATSLQLLELARPTHPLFQRLLTGAPGTYHHSIVISNMAERAAGAIGADTLLARVGSYYHDIGKTARPYFFSENQSDGENPHDKLDPKTSADIIIGHTTDGLALARRHKLPDRICAFIPEHHGTTLVAYFYRRANQQAAEGDIVREEDYRYPGPRPQSKETAIVMLADSVEAWVRANRPPTQAEMERVIRQVINDRLISGQLDECDLTLRDLDNIRQAFVSVLQGIFHPRIQYPDPVPRQNGRPAGETAG